MSEYSPSDVIDFVLDDDVTSVQTAVNDILRDKMSEFLATKKIEVAKNLFSPED